jgi:signal transduction histidine kinase
MELLPRAVAGGCMPTAGACGLLLGLLLAVGLGCYWLGRRHGCRLQPQQQDQIRSSIAANLHDELGSLLTRISMQVEALRTASPSPAVERLLTDTRAASSALRDVAWGLDASADTLGALQDRIHDQLDQLALTNLLTIKFVPEGLDAALVLPPQLRQEVYLLFKEATANVLRHARQATTLVVHLYRRKGRLILEVLDNGMPTTGVVPRSGMGLRSMKARARVVGGDLEVGPRTDGLGFRVCLCAPLEPWQYLAG